MSCSAVPETPRIGKTGGEDSTLWRLDDVVSGEMSSELAVGKKRCATDASDSFLAVVGKKVVAACPKVDEAKAAAQGPRGEAGGEKLEIKGKEAKNKQARFTFLGLPSIFPKRLRFYQEKCNAHGNQSLFGIHRLSFSPDILRFACLLCYIA